MILLLAGVALVAGGGLAAALAGRRSRLATTMALAGTIAGSAVGMIAAARTLGSASDEVVRFAWTLPIGALLFRLDPLAALFLAVLFVVAPLAAIYGAGYLADAGRRRSLGGVWFFYGLLVGGMALVLVAADAVLFLIAWEVMSLAAFFLVTFEDERAEVREAGWTYLIATHIGTAFLIGFFALMARSAGSFEFAAMAARVPAVGTVRWVAFLAAVVGFGTKAGFFPLHVWLPEAHPAAPSHVSALMSGVMIKMGIYGLLRSLAILSGPAPWWGWLLVGIGAASAFFGVLFAIAQHDLKRLLAYHSVENIGIITLGIGLGVVGAATGSAGLAFLGLAGALFHVVNHALFKSLLFLGAGSVLHATGTRDMDRLGGLLKTMPVTGATFLVGAVAISGLPPLNGFASELVIYLGAFGHGLTGRGALVVPALVTVVALSLVGGLASACFGKAFGAVFLGEAREEHPHPAHEAARAMVAPMVLLAASCALVALAAPQVVRVVAIAVRPVAVALGAPVSAGPLETSVRALGWVQVAAVILFGLVISLGSLRMWLLRRRDVRAAATWDCGYLAPSPRMEYTASSFAQPLVDLFSTVLRTKRRLDAPDGLFPTHASFASDTPDVVTEGVLRPLFVKVGATLAGWRFLQQGRVQVYVLYIAVTLILLLVWKVVRL